MSSTLQPRESTPEESTFSEITSGKPGKHPRTGRERFLDACACRPLDYPPVWLMRQAGRALPEYRALKQKFTFLQLVQNPELAAEVTLQPIRRFQFDGAILFCDILAIAEGLGQGYQFREPGGITMDFLLQNAQDIQRLEVDAVPERLQYVARALALIKGELAGRAALIGFAGSPWTLANFMIEGGGVKEYTKARELFYSNRADFNLLMEKLTEAVTRFLQLQINAGAEAVQIFDSLGGLLSGRDFVSASGQWMRRIVESLNGQVPVIVFSKGTHSNWEDLGVIGANVLGIDWNVNMAQVTRSLPKSVAVQGNLDPFLLGTQPEFVAAEAKSILREMAGRPGHIFNLGHGVPPNAKLENIERLIETVRNPAHSIGEAQ
jgi:uroporphyrinogen decarboxylase